MSPLSEFENDPIVYPVWGDGSPDDVLFLYKARVHSIYDGDTMRVDIDLGFSHLLMNQQIRLYGIDTPELRGEEREEGLKVRDYVRQLIPVGSEIFIQTQKDRTGKYGRWLGTIWFEKPGVWMNLNQHLIDVGMAKPIFY